jgi:hypothetical protein
MMLEKRIETENFVHSLGTREGNRSQGQYPRQVKPAAAKEVGGTRDYQAIPQAASPRPAAATVRGNNFRPRSQQQATTSKRLDGNRIVIIHGYI